MAAENFRSLSNIAPLIVVGNLEFAVKRNVISRRFVVLMVMIFFFLICCSQKRNLESILDKLKATYFATHGSSFPLTGNKYFYF